MDKNKLYNWSCYFGRSGELESLFLATDEELNDLKRCGTIHFYEALGRHSCPEVDFANEEFILVTDDQKVIEILSPHLPIGLDLFGNAEEKILQMKEKEKHLCEEEDV